MDPIAKSSAEFENMTKLDIFVNAKGNGTTLNREIFMVNTYCESNEADAKATSHEVIESDLAVSHRLQKTQYDRFEWLFVMVGELTIPKAIPRFSEKRTQRGER